ncbi:S1 family peptidase [Nocardiopsis chromatogenes]|uniref:S1 family peptidase n=1 Tax=Nocardiopsis chromatogenes TaxID=280239 RepID=UPI000A01D878|nr:trypsin-like serine protease [Nocardiopsis chromatogenes]
MPADAVSRTGSLAISASLALVVGASGTAHADAASGGGAETRIVDGSPASVADHPWMVALTDPEDFPGRPGGQHCGGALVRPDKVVTAAHCVDEPEDREGLQVVAGRTDLRTDAGWTREAVAVWSHDQVVPEPEPGSDLTPRPGGDVAVVTLDRPLPLPTLPLARPGDGDLTDPGRTGTVLGWGATDVGRPREGSPVLMKARVPILDDDTWTRSAEAYGLLYDPAHFAGAGFSSGGPAIGPGDSGGPLVVDGRLVGVVHDQIPIDGPPPDLSRLYSLFSEVPAFAHAIDDHLGPGARGPRLPEWRHGH